MEECTSASISAMATITNARHDSQCSVWFRASINRSRQATRSGWKPFVFPSLPWKHRTIKALLSLIHSRLWCSQRNNSSYRTLRRPTRPIEKRSPSPCKVTRSPSSPNQQKGTPLIMSDKQITSSNQSTAKNSAWVNVTVTVNYSDGSTKQTSHIEPRVKG